MTWIRHIIHDRNLTIRLKIILAFIFFMAVAGTIWFLSYYNLFIMKQKLLLIEKKDNLFNTILEARRYEKNFLLTKDRSHLQLARDYALEAERKILKILSDFGRYAAAKNLSDQVEKIREYIRLLEAFGRHYDAEDIEGFAPTGPGEFVSFQDRIRTIGKSITDSLEEMVNQERRYVSSLFKELQLYLFVALTAILILTMAMAFFLYHFVNLPLKSIEEAIAKITSGDYTAIPKLTRGDEFESFVESLNRMIGELNRRGEQLVQSEKMASLGTLTSGVAHELNNPLNNISTSLQILLEEIEDRDTDFQRDLIRESEVQVDRARDIVKALLEFSRKKSFNLSRVRFKDLMEETRKLIKGEIPSQVEVVIDVPDDIVIQMDHRRIQQALINLLMNASQAIDNSGKITVNAWIAVEDKRFYFTVEDTGEGIPEDRVNKIFDPFFTTKDVGQGSGLGLSVTHGIIDQHGGRITVESAPGTGTCFTVELPLEREEHEPDNDVGGE